MCSGSTCWDAVFLIMHMFFLIPCQTTLFSQPISRVYVYFWNLRELKGILISPSCTYSWSYHSSQAESETKRSWGNLPKMTNHVGSWVKSKIQFLSTNRNIYHIYILNVSLKSFVEKGKSININTVLRFGFPFQRMLNGGKGKKRNINRKKNDERWPHRK